MAGIKDFGADNHTTLKGAAIEQVILPKKGKHNKEDKARESDPAFKKLRNAHSAVESNINMLEHHGLNRCLDKGIKGYKRCVGLSVLAYNLHILGNVLKAKTQADEAKREKRRLKQAASERKGTFKTVTCGGSMSNTKKIEFKCK